MRLRAVQLACLVLLLSSMSAAKGTTLRSGEFGLGGNYISRLLAHDHASSAAADNATLRAQLDDTRTTEIPATAEAHVRIAWAMRPPALHTAAVRAFTGTEV
jgi:hypothetical protein